MATNGKKRYGYSGSSAEAKFWRDCWKVFLVKNSRCVSVTVAIGVGVRVPGIRIVSVVIRAQVVPDLVYVRKVRQTVGVHNRVAVLGESRCRGLHGEPAAREYVKSGENGRRGLVQTFPDFILRRSAGI